MFKQRIVDLALAEVQGLGQAVRQQLRAHARNLRRHPLLAALAWLGLTILAFGVLLPPGYHDDGNPPLAALTLVATCYGLTALVLLFPTLTTWLRWQSMSSEYEQLYLALPQRSKVERRAAMQQQNRVQMRRMVPFMATMLVLLLLSYLGLFSILVSLLFALGGPLTTTWLRRLPARPKES